MREAHWEALGTSAVLKLTGSTDPSALAVARAAVEAELAAIDRACSRFRKDSDLSQVNANAGCFVGVDGRLIEALEVALRAARLTDGDVDPTLGAALVRAGYDRDWSLMELDQGDHEDRRSGRRRRVISARPRSGWRLVELDRAAGAVRVPPGVQLDLGATAKAWAADRAALLAHEASGVGTLVSLGGDVATAGPAPAAGWRVHVTEDHRDGIGAPGQTVAIFGGGLATSSTTVRRWTLEGESRHHIIDPETGAPAEGFWRTASVAAGNCTDGNIASTATLVRGPQAARWLDQLELPARLVSQDGHVRLVGEWPAMDRRGDRAA